MRKCSGARVGAHTNFNESKVYQPRGTHEEFQNEAKCVQYAAPRADEQGPEVDT